MSVGNKCLNFKLAPVCSMFVEPGFYTVLKDFQIGIK